jgi:citrate synthase
MGEEVEVKRGLEGVYVAESKICLVDGTGGRLYYRGFPIGPLAENSNYEEVCYLILYGSLPKKEQLDAFVAELKKERSLPDEIVGIIRKMAKTSHPMHVLRTAASALAVYDPEAEVNTIEANIRKSIRIISKFSSIVAAIGSFRGGRDYIAPDQSLGHAANFLYMLRGKKPSDKEARLLDTMFILHAEHSSNASTFATLVAGSTLSDIYSAVTSGTATLKGPLHGGADEAALKMLYAIGKPENTESYIDDALANKQRIMGFGHRVYKTYDPRAKIIKKDLEELQVSASEEVRNLTSIALRAERMMIERLGQSHGIWPNVDFFSGPVYVSLGIEPALFTPVFAASRTVGWCAHMIEYWQDNKLFRPLEKYTGHLDLTYVPINDRK